MLPASSHFLFQRLNDLSRWFIDIPLYYNITLWYTITSDILLIMNGESEKLGKNLNKIRTSKKISQGDIARSLGVSRGFISNIENGKTNPTLATISNLHKANRAKKDEFYTQLIDIEKELKHYKEQFRDKVVYCNCDDPFESNFFKYFASNFNVLGLKKLIATSYKPSPIANTQLGLFGDDKKLSKSKGRPKTTANKFIINEASDFDGDGAFDLHDIAEQLKANKNNEWAPLKGDGDFKSPESIELLKQADIVVTNPPFSLFREYVAQLVEYDKKFLILGQQGAVIYKEFIPLIKENKMLTV